MYFKAFLMASNAIHSCFQSSYWKDIILSCPHKDYQKDYQKSIGGQQRDMEDFNFLLTWSDILDFCSPALVDLKRQISS